MLDSTFYLRESNMLAIRAVCVRTAIDAWVETDKHPYRIHRVRRRYADARCVDIALGISRFAAADVEAL